VVRVQHTESAIILSFRDTKRTETLGNVALYLETTTVPRVWCELLHRTHVTYTAKRGQSVTLL